MEPFAVELRAMSGELATDQVSPTTDRTIGEVCDGRAVRPRTTDGWRDGFIGRWTEGWMDGWMADFEFVEYLLVADKAEILAIVTL